MKILELEFVPDETDSNVMREDALKITAVVSWTDRGEGNDVSVSTILTNWQ